MGVSFEINGFGCGIGVILFFFFFGRGRRRGGLRTGRGCGKIQLVSCDNGWCLVGLEAWLVVFSEVSLCH